MYCTFFKAPVLKKDQQKNALHAPPFTLLSLHCAHCAGVFCQNNNDQLGTTQIDPEHQACSTELHILASHLCSLTAGIFEALCNTYN